MQQYKTYEDVMQALRQTRIVELSTYAMLLSFFYNLPVISYAARGNNELRIFDFAGLVIMIFYFRNYNLINSIINTIQVLRYLKQFLMLCNFLMIPTCVDAILRDKPYWIFQSLLYLFHFWAFYIASIFLIVMIRDTRYLRRIVIWMLLMSCGAFFLVVLQNFGLVPFLWNDSYRRAYSGFLSGTFGPNKIVLGMTALIMFTVAIGLINEKRIMLPRWLLYLTLLLSVLALAFSGSRTSYLGFGVFGFYFMMKQTSRFIISVTVVGVLMLGAFAVSPKLRSKLEEVYTVRIEKKITKPNRNGPQSADELYEDLGSGRKGLSLLYLQYLTDNPYIIPLGIGFNNRMALISSAHNIYLSLINEVGVIGTFFYFRWLFAYMFVRMPQFPSMRMALKGLTLAMLVTLAFGEHLYIYRVLFGLVGLFMFATIILMSPIFVKPEHASNPEPEPGGG